MNTYGWDVISVLSTAILNQQLKTNFSQLLTTFSFTNQGSPTSSAITGQFADWQIVGGANSDINVALTIASGTYSYTDTAAPQNNQQFQLAGVVVTVQIAVAFLPAINGTQQQLQFSFSTTNGQMPAGQAVSYVSSTLPAGSAIDAITQVVIGDYVAQCLSQNAAQVSYVFASLSTAAGNGLPALANFAFTLLTLTSPASEYFCILSTLQPGPAPAISVDSALVDGSTNAYLNLSSAYFLQYVIQPQLPTVFGNGTTAGSFTYMATVDAPTPVPVSCLVSTGAFNMNQVKSGLIWYQPVITALNISIVGAALCTDISGTCHISPGIDLSFSSSSNSGVALAAGGVSITADANPSISHSLHVATGIIVITALISPIIAAIIGVIVYEVAQGIASGLNGEAGVVSLQQLNPSFLTWQNFQLTRLQSAGLDETFFLRGNP